MDAPGYDVNLLLKLSPLHMIQRCALLTSSSFLQVVSYTWPGCHAAPECLTPLCTFPSTEVIRTWCKADAVCFDVDSTVCLDEGIDELADFCGAGPAVAEWTSKAMTGSVPFEEALAARLSLFKPSLYQVNECMEKRPPRISPGIAKLIKRLRAKNVDIYLVSGGFRQMFKMCSYKTLVMIGDGATDLEVYIAVFGPHLLSWVVM
ncbi:hypothetical protein ACQ4PT_026860 [Festuca glaucescens]